MEKRNSQLKHGQPMEQTRGLHMRLRCGSLSIIIVTQVSLLVNAFYVRNVLHEQGILAAVNQICVIHEAMNGCKKKNLKIH